MRKSHFLSLVVISMMLILGLSAGSVIAKPGGVKADSDQNCEDVDKEDNEIDSCVSLWVNTGGRDVNPGTVCVEVISHSTKNVIQIPDVSFISCGSDRPPFYYNAFLDISGADIGVVTVVVHEGDCDSKTIGNDSFVYLGGCV